jgi:hypothetical protein
MVLSIPHPRGRPSIDEVASGKVEIENLERIIKDLEANIEGLQSELEECEKLYQPSFYILYLFYIIVVYVY